MAVSKFHQDTHKALTDALSDYHQELADIDIEQRKLEQRRAIVKATAAAEIESLSHQLKVSPDIAASTVAACW